MFPGYFKNRMKQPLPFFLSTQFLYFNNPFFLWTEIYDQIFLMIVSGEFQVAIDAVFNIIRIDQCQSGCPFPGRWNVGRWDDV